MSPAGDDAFAWQQAAKLIEALERLDAQHRALVAVVGREVAQHAVLFGADHECALCTAYADVESRP